MITIQVDRFVLGAIAEESRTAIETFPDKWERTTHVRLAVELLVGQGRVRFEATAPKGEAVVPPEFLPKE